MTNNGPSNADSSFYIHEDDWGLIEILPAENLCNSLEGFRQQREHHKDTAFGPTGWTTRPFVIPTPQVELVQRAIPLPEIASLVGPVLPQATVVLTSDTTTGPKDVCLL